MKKTIIITSILVVVVSFTSCKKDNRAFPPLITINNITEGQTFTAFSNADMLPVNISISDDDLKSYSVSLKSVSGTKVLIDIPETAATINTITINQYADIWRKDGKYILTVNAIDKRNNISTKSINLYIYSEEIIMI